VKVYVRHHRATPVDLEIASGYSKSYLPGEALDFVRAMRGGDDHVELRAAASCSAFVAEGGPHPTSTTIYVPVCAYARDDLVVKARFHRYLTERGIDARRYGAIIDGYANRPLDAGVGMQSWIALRRHRGKARFTVYLATEANRVFAPGAVPAPTAAPGLVQQGERP
jgi:hypothetical protein